MAKINSVAIGKASGSIGNVTFQGWKGIQTARQKPTEVANPKTMGQQNQRAKMTTIIALFRTAASILSLGFKQLAVKKSAYNAFVQENLKNGCITVADAVTSFVAGLFMAAKGTLPVTPETNVSASAALDTVTVEWSDVPAEGQSTDDLVNILVLSEAGAYLGKAIDFAQRSEGVAQIQLDANINAAQTIAVYFFFRNPVTGAVSDSVYNSVVVAA